MAPGKERQTSFAAGELAPGLHGRTDLPQYAVGSRTLLNFMVSEHGVVEARTGTQHVRSYTNANDYPARPIPFVVSPSEAYILVLKAADRWIDVWRAYEQDPRHSFQFVTQLYLPALSELYDDALTGLFGYNSAQIRGLRWAQSGLALTLCADDKGVIEIRFTPPGTWVVDRLITIPREFPLRYGYPPDEPHPRMHFATTAEETKANEGSAEEAALPRRAWQWAVSHVLKRATDGQVYETQPYVVTRRHLVGSGSSLVPESTTTLLGDHAVYPVKPRTFWTYQKAGDVMSGYDNEHTWANGETVVATRLYRGRDGRYGFIAESTGYYTMDDGADPDYSDPPRAASGPFMSVSGAVYTLLEKPRVPFYYEGRRGLASTEERPSTVWESAVEMHDVFDEVIPPDDIDPLEFTIATGAGRAKVNWAVDLGVLLVGTDAGVFIAQGTGDNGLLTANSIWVHRLNHVGAADLRPALAGGSMFFADSKGSAPVMIERVEGGGFAVVDPAVLANHLFDGYTIASWDYLTHPRRTLLAARSDGVLLSCTYVPELNIMAWARHEIAGGTVEFVVGVPESTEDAAYLMVRYGSGVRGLERLAPRHLPLNALGAPDVRYCLHLDRAVSWNGLQLGTMAVTTAAAYAIGDSVPITISLGAAVVAAGDIVQVDADDGTQPWRFTVVSDDGGGAYTMQLTSKAMAAADCFAASPWWVCRSAVSGLSHLDGQTVTVLGDGDAYEEVVVSSGSASIGEGNECGLLTAGVPYDCDFESLDSARRDLRQKILKRVGIELEHTRGGHVGADLDHLTEIRTRSVSDAYLPIPLVRRDEVEPVVDEWGTGGRCAVRQSAPYPMRILGIMRDLDVRGD